ncbi:hypothetical protein LINPERPRIM_LOCUS21101 [Linum perenne]
MATPKSLADYSKPSASNVLSPITVPSNDDDPDYEIKIPFLGLISKDALCRSTGDKEHVGSNGKSIGARTEEIWPLQN